VSEDPASNVWLALLAVDWNVLRRGMLSIQNAAIVPLYLESKEAISPLSIILLLLLLLLPFAIFGMAREALSSVLGWERAPTMRHVADVVQAVTLLGLILPTVFLKLNPLQVHLATCTSRLRASTLRGTQPWQRLTMPTLPSPPRAYDVQDVAKAACSPAPLRSAPSGCKDALEDLKYMHLVMVLLNVLMFACDITKFATNRGASYKAKAA
jgi:hypothetical protein